MSSPNNTAAPTKPSYLFFTYPHIVIYRSLLYKLPYICDSPIYQVHLRTQQKTLGIKAIEIDNKKPICTERTNGFFIFLTLKTVRMPHEEKLQRVNLFYL
jgi:hypothetical protein